LDRPTCSFHAWASRGVEFGPYAGEEPDVSRAAAVIRAGIESGINWLDTSENYLDTRNEALIGAALAGTEEFLVATKVAPGAAASGGGSGFRRVRFTRRAATVCVGSAGSRSTCTSCTGRTTRECRSKKRGTR